MKTTLRIIGVGLVVAATAFVAAPSALACSPSSHCYGRVNWTTPASTYTGSIAYLTASRLSVSNPNSQFITHEMWDVTDSVTAWVEAGLTVGPINGVNHGLAIFWAEANTVGSYAEHYVQNASLNTTYIVKISHSGSGSWGVYLNGTSVGGSSHNHSTALTDLAAGLELVSNDATATGTMTGLQKRTTSNSWNYGWTTNNFDQNPPTTSGWTSAYTDAWDKAN
jgi:hypothetical protein